MLWRHGQRKATCEWRFYWTIFVSPPYCFASSCTGHTDVFDSWVQHMPAWKPAPTIIGGRMQREAVLRALEKL